MSYPAPNPEKDYWANFIGFHKAVTVIDWNNAAYKLKHTYKKPNSIHSKIETEIAVSQAKGGI
jgi:hypothetical protein